MGPLAHIFSSSVFLVLNGVSAGLLVAEERLWKFSIGSHSSNIKHI